MIDFNNASFLKLKPVGENAFASMITPMFVEGEVILQSFQSIRDGVVFTNKRIFCHQCSGADWQEKGLFLLALQQDPGILR